MDPVWINNRKYEIDEYVEGSFTLTGLPDFEKKIISTIIDFLEKKKTFIFKTSGTTGKTKNIRVSRESMVASAKMTLEYFKVTPGQNALLCLDPEYIAGTMMIIRSIVGKLNLYAVSPASNPLSAFRENISVQLCAMVPVQLREVLTHEPALHKLKQIKTLLVGGAPLDPSLIHLARKLSTGIYQTFGMTETVSHIAIRKINSSSDQAIYETLPGIVIGQDNRKCLTIQGPVTNHKMTITNDLVEILDNNRFLWIGRLDNMINSGGIKLSVEHLEEKISLILKNNSIPYDFFLTGIPDPQLGEKLCIVFEIKEDLPDFQYIKKIIKSSLDKYEMPREWKKTMYFNRTPTQKINRKKSLNESEAVS